MAEIIAPDQFRNKGGRPRRYSDQQRAEALAIYADKGPSEAERVTGISKSMVTRWAKEMGIETNVITQAAEAVATIRATNEERRKRVQEKLLERAEWTLDRFDQPHIDFRGTHADQVTYPVAPASAVGAYSAAAATLMQEYRKEMGEVPGRTGIVIDLNSHFARVAIEMGLDPAEVEAEAQKLLADPVILPGEAKRIDG